MNFARERAHDVWQDMQPLFEKHWSEIAHYKDIPLEPDYELYMKMEELGNLRVFVARDDDRTITGYAVFFIKHNLHYKSSLQALQDIIFIDPAQRGMFGGRFILWCERELRNEGVQIVFQHIKVSTPQTIAMFERMGYEKVDMILGKRLDKKDGA